LAFEMLQKGLRILHQTSGTGKLAVEILRGIQ